MTGAVDQAAVTRRYERLAPVYDIYNGPMEWLGLREKRRRLLSRAAGRVLEAGVGTGRNLEHYPPGTSLVGVDVSRRMLRLASDRAARLGRAVTLDRADVQRLPFRDGVFDTVVATCLFCSVPDPVHGLAELGRVVKEPDGRLLLLEHVRPRSRLLGGLADLLSPLTRRLLGFNLDRGTEDNVLAAGLEVLDVRRRGIWREIVARSTRCETHTPGLTSRESGR